MTNKDLLELIPKVIDEQIDRRLRVVTDMELIIERQEWHIEHLSAKILDLTARLKQLEANQ